MSVRQHRLQLGTRLQAWLLRLVGRLPLKVVLTVPFILLSLGLVALLEGLAWHIHQQAIQATLAQLQLPETDRLAAALFQAQIANCRIHLGVASLVTVLATGALGVWLSHHLAAPLRQLIQASYVVSSHGGLGRDKQRIYPSSAITEINALSHAWAQMLAPLNPPACPQTTREDGDDHTESEQPYLRQNQDLKSLLENIPHIVARLAPQLSDQSHSNPRYEFLYINSYIEKILPIKVTELINRTSEELSLPVNFLTTWNTSIDRVFTTQQEQQIEYTFTHEGKPQYWSARLVPEFAADGAVATVLVVACNVTDLKQAELALQKREECLRHILDHMPVMLDALDDNGQLIVWNQECERVTGYSAQEMLHNPEAFTWLYPDTNYRESMMRLWRERGNNYRNWEWEITCKNGQKKTISWSNLSEEFPIRGWFAWGIGVDVSDRKQAEQALQKRIEHERLIATITQHIRQSLDLPEVLHTTVTEIQRLLQADRALIYQLRMDGSGTVIAEAVIPDYPQILGESFAASVFPADYQDLYRQGRVHAIADIHAPDLELSPCWVELLAQWAVRSKLIVPILMPSAAAPSSNTLWGVLVVHQCAKPRQWHTTEIELLVQLADQIALVIKQSELYQTVQQFNVHLEAEVQERTQQLQQAFEFEATLKQITDQVRDSLDEAKILQTAVEALALALGARGCNTALYDLEAQTSTIKYEYTTFAKPFRNYTMRMQNFPIGYRQLLAGQYFQYCSLSPYPQRGRVATLACPMQNDQGVLGDLWVINEPNYGFTEPEIRLVQQVANQCAIALRQARLYQASQTQVQELERLNQLKDDFLSTVSHELRTPLANMNSALKMLQLFLQQPGLFSDQAETLRIKPDRALQYLDIMQAQYHQELNLVNDLLDLARLEAGTALPTLVPIDLELCLSQWVANFQERVNRQQQTLQLDLGKDIPVVISDPQILERTISELINNACKYTPPEGQIKVQLSTTLDTIKIAVINTGSEIPKTELPYIFDKFYRVPSGDRWKHGGTQKC
ncbi:sensor histidine kinase [Trichothermofontia sp.]